jgi:hypothetical protein
VPSDSKVTGVRRGWPMAGSGSSMGCWAGRPSWLFPVTHVAEPTEPTLRPWRERKLEQLRGARHFTEPNWTRPHRI